VSKGPDAFRTISEVAEDLDLPQHVLRFWETRFTQIKPMKRGGGRRYYRPDDIDLLRGIRHLLYAEGYTIKGVQRILKEQGARFVIAAGRGEMAGIPARDQRDEGEDAADLEAMRAAALEGSDLGPEEFEADGEPVDFPAAPGNHGEGGDNGGAFAQAKRFFGRFGHDGGRETVGQPSGFAPEEIQQLQATLGELLELKRLLDQAR
jgi:DNA-binding transcriptional MerR regulator